MSPEQREAYLLSRKEYREKNKEKLRAQAAAHRAKHWSKFRERDQKTAEHRRIGNYTREWKYGLAKGQFDEMMKAQDGKCAICPRDLKPCQGTHVDHDHVTGKVRGLLCPRCNRNVALLDDEELLAKTAAYVLTHKTRKLRVA